jgi:hypothetical protein
MRMSICILRILDRVGSKVDYEVRLVVDRRCI